MKQTAVEWLFEKMTEQGTNPYWDMRFIQAKNMEEANLLRYGAKCFIIGVLSPIVGILIAIFI